MQRALGKPCKSYFQVDKLWDEWIVGGIYTVYIQNIYLYKIHLGAPIVWDKWIVGGYTVVVGPPAPALSSVQSLNGRQMIKISSHCQYFTEIDFANCPRNWHFFPETVSIFCTNCFSFNNWSRMQRDQRHFISYFLGIIQKSSPELYCLNCTLILNINIEHQGRFLDYWR